jgi:hypothetical protein
MSKNNGRTGISIIGWFLIIAGLLVLPTAFLSVPAGIGVLRKKEWGRLSAIIFECLQLLAAMAALAVGLLSLILNEALWGLILSGPVGIIVAIRIIRPEKRLTRRFSGCNA